MSFIAGVVGRNGKLEAELKQRFLDSLTAIEKELPWPIETRETSKYVLARSGFPHMWQGSKILTGPNYDAVATGVQWRKISNKRMALEYLTSVLLTEGREIGNYFDYFSCAIVDNNNHHTILATDPLGMSPMLYKINSKVLVFSSHQSFLKSFLGQDIEINWQAVFEHLTIGHNIGNKTLFKNVNILPSGCKLEMYQNKLRVVQYAKFDNVNIKEEMTLKDATNLIFEHMEQKIESYSALAPKPFASFLSGGWDTRFIASLLVRTGKVAMTYTTQQNTRFQNRLISEQKIAREVAKYLGLNNEFVAPKSRGPKSLNERARIMDFTTWFHSWSFAMAERLPYDKFILCDGLSGDMWLRELYITRALHRCIIEQNKEEAIKILYSMYLEGFNVYTPSIEKWKSVINSHYLNKFADMLIHDISEEIYNIHSDNFVTLFLFKNRSRRGISPLPRLIFGRKGIVILPFCDFEFIQKALSIPIEYKLNHSLYKALLEKSKPGLSNIASTNTKDADKLEPYLVDSLPGQLWRGQIVSMMREHYPKVHGALKGLKNMLSEIGDNVWAKEIVKNPPFVFMDILTPELQRAIKSGNIAYIKKFRFFLERIMPLDRFFREGDIKLETTRQKITKR